MLDNILHEMLGVKDRYRISSLLRRGSAVVDFLNQLSSEVKKKIETVGNELGTRKFKTFKPKSTRLTPEMISDIWEEVSHLLGEKIMEINAGDDIERKIPGLKDSIERGTIVSVTGTEFSSINPAESDAARKEMLERLPKMNDAAELIANLRNELFSYFQKEFKLYSEQEQEMKVEQKERRR